VRFFIDIDGTITEEQRAKSWYRSKPRLDVIEKIQKLYNEGHEIILWSGNTNYAQKVAQDLEDKYGIKVVAAIGKPEVIVDNQQRRWGKRLHRRTILPCEFLEKEY